MKFKHFINTALLRNILITASLCITAFAPLHADDTEIFFGQSDDTFEANPNIIFVLDISGSMGKTDDVGISRLNRMKNAMRLILDQSSNYNVGLMAFQGRDGGSSVRYPIGDLDGEATEMCPGGVCPAETVFVRPIDPSDDAYQNDDTLAMSLNDDYFILGSADAETIDNAVGETPELVPSSENAVLVTKSYTAHSSGQENNNHVDPDFFWRFNQLENDWFYEGEDYQDSIFGYQFHEINIPINSRVLDASITFQLAGTSSQVGDVSVFITGEQTSDPEPFPEVASGFSNGNHPFTSRIDFNNRTNEVVSWDSVPGSATNPADAGNRITTPNLAHIVNEIIQLPEWSKGENMSFMVSPLDTYISKPENLRTVYGKGAAEINQPVLTITYEKLEEDEIPVQTIEVEASEHIDEFYNSNDDTVWRNTTNSMSRMFYVGGGNDPRQLALRFPNVDIPENATIKSAFLKVTAFDSSVPQSSISNDWDLVSGTDLDGFNGGDDSTSTTVFSEILKVNIHSELSANPTADTTTPLRERDKTLDFVTWDAQLTSISSFLGPFLNPFLESPSLSRVVQEAIDLPEWENGKDLSLILVPDGGYVDNVDSVISILTSQSNSKPKLEITYSIPVEVAPDEISSYTTAIRFRNVHIPPNATIVSAHMNMTAAAVNSGDAVVNIRGEFTDNSKAFTLDNNNIGQRDPTDASVSWNLTNWTSPGNEYKSVPVTPIIQEITSRSNWCGGNALTLILKGAEGLRFAQTVEQDIINAPSLEITYEPDSVVTDGYCSNSSIILSSARGTDDGVENRNTGSLSLNDTFLSTSRTATGDSNNILGLRFSGLQIPQGAEISGATLEFIAAKELPNDIDVQISIEQKDQALIYSSNNNQSKISGRQYNNGITWSQRGNIASGEPLYTSDISSLIKSVVDEPGWKPGNAVAFKLEARSGELDVVSNDGDESSVPQLIIYFQTIREAPGTQNREQIQQSVNDLLAVGGTPIVEAFYEAALYMRGGKVDYGIRRGISNKFKRWYRVSHPGSYEGGSVSRPSGCLDTNLSSNRCRFELIRHTPSEARYTSPIVSQCQSNHIVLLSDGKPTSNTAVSRTQNMIGQSCDNSVNEFERCGTELSSWLKNSDQSNKFAGDQTVTTHTIGFNLTDPKFLIDIADASNGVFEPAESASELLAAFKKIINNVSNRNASFVAPGATVSQFNRLRNSNDVYYAMFKPSGTARWQGNLKRYAIDQDSDEEFTLIDSRGNVAVDPNTGTFSKNSKSFWSSITDGDNVELGGASEQLNLSNFTQRNVYTYNESEGNTNLYEAENQFDSSNNTLNIDTFNLPPLISNDPEGLSDLIDWGKGADIRDENGDGDTQQLRAFMGDPMHAVPLVTNYEDGESVVYMATNEGFLHAIDTDTGKEHFAFIPEDLYKNIYRFYNNEATSSRPYGLDGGKTLWHNDTDKDGRIDSNETAILYIAMRRGGNSYYALDISEYKKPRYLWSIKGGKISDGSEKTTAEGDYTDLSSTWSLPVKTKILDGSEVKDVIVFGGGYDRNQDPLTDIVVDGVVVPSNDVRNQDSRGTAIFIADAETGELIWKTNKLGDFDEMKYSIPSTIRVLDVNFDGIVDQLYVGDMGGQLWRMDFNNSLVSTDSIASRIRAGVIADIAGDSAASNRKFYYPPDIAVISIEGKQVLSISIGSGWRAHPLDEFVEDRIYSFRSPHVFGAPINKFGELKYTTIRETDAAFIDVTDDLDAAINAESLGWYIRLENKGEKVLGSSLTFNNHLILTSYLPSSTLFSCDAAIGSGSVYVLNIFNGAPLLNLDDLGNDTELTENDRSRVLANPGLPPEVSVLFPETEGAVQPLFQVGKETISELDGIGTSQTTFWQEVSENHDE